MARLLLLTPQLPYPPHQGTTIRNWHVVQYLAARHDVDLLAFAGDPALALDQARPLRALCHRLAVLPAPGRPLHRRLFDLLRGHADMARRLHNPAFARVLSAWLAEGYDVVQAEGIEMASYLLAVQATVMRTAAPRLVYDAHNAEALLQRRNCLNDARHPRRWVTALYSLAQWRLLTVLERQLLRQVDRVVAVSEPDAAALRRLLPEVHPLVAPNGVDTDYYDPDALPEEPAPLPPVVPWLVFTGKLDYRPNIEACQWLVERVMPRVWAARPAVGVALVGRDPAPPVARLAGGAVRVTGWVPDTRPYLRAATLCVVPLRVGGGTRLKILEALAMSCAVVSTTQGAEGLALDETVVLADSPDDFARAILTLLDDPARRRALGQAGWRLVDARYAWRAVLPALDELYA